MTSNPFIFSLTLVLTLCLPGFSKAQQEVQINGKHFTVVSKVQLGSNTEYLTVKEKSAAQADNQAYVKTKNGCFKSVFSEKEWKSFLQKGTLSSLGELSSLQATKKKKITCIKKAGVQVLLAISNGEMIIIEYPGDPVVMFSNNDSDPGGGNPPPKLNACQRKCRDDLDDCDSIIVDNPGTDDTCLFAFFICVENCNKEKQGTADKSIFVSYHVDVKNLSVKAR